MRIVDLKDSKESERVGSHLPILTISYDLYSDSPEEPEKDQERSRIGKSRSIAHVTCIGTIEQNGSSPLWIGYDLRSHRLSPPESRQLPSRKLPR